MKTFNPALRPVHYASVSGGKDSKYMMKVILENLDKYPLDMVVHFELEIDYPWIKESVDGIERLCESIGVKFVRIRPRTSFNELKEKYGLPTRRVRWCNGKYKLDCEAQLVEWIKAQGCRPVAYIGFCSDETDRFKYTVGCIEDGQDVIYPLAEEGINENFVLEWACKIDSFNGWYKYFDRQGCQFCPMSTYREWAYNLIKYPTETKKRLEEIRTFEQEYHTTYFQSNPKYNIDYIEERLYNKYVPMMLDEMSRNGDYTHEN